MANFQRTITLNHVNAVQEIIIGKDDAGTQGPITSLALTGQNIPAGCPTQSLNSATGQVTYTPGSGYGTSTFNYRAVNASGAFVYVDVTVTDPAPVIATHLDFQ